MARTLPVTKKTLTASSTGLWTGRKGHQMVGLGMRARKEEDCPGMITPNMGAGHLRLRRQHLRGQASRGEADTWEEIWEA